MKPKKFSRLCAFKGFLPNVTHYLEYERYCCTHKQILFNQTADILLAWFLTSWSVPSAKAKKLLNCKGFKLNLNNRHML